MRPHYKIITQPTNEPVTNDEVSEHLRVDSDDDSGYVDGLVSVAREYVDSITGRISALTTFRLTGKTFRDLTLDDGKTIKIMRSPLVSVESIQYYASGDTELSTMSESDYRVMTSSEPAIITLTGTLPSLEDREDAVQIEFIAGYDAPEETPPGLKHAIKMLACHLYENRVPVSAGSEIKNIPYTLEALIANQKAGDRF